MTKQPTRFALVALVLSGVLVVAGCATPVDEEEEGGGEGHAVQQPDEHGQSAKPDPENVGKVSQEIQGTYVCATKFWATSNTFTYLRTNPSSSGWRIAGVGAGQTVRVLKNLANNTVMPQNGYYFVEWMGHNGWVLGSAFPYFSCHP